LVNVATDHALKAIVEERLAGVWLEVRGHGCSKACGMKAIVKATCTGEETDDGGIFHFWRLLSQRC
jgi:hypothetical protein